MGQRNECEALHTGSADEVQRRPGGGVQQRGLGLLDKLHGGLERAILLQNGAAGHNIDADDREDHDGTLEYGDLGDGLDAAGQGIDQGDHGKEQYADAIVASAGYDGKQAAAAGKLAGGVRNEEDDEAQAQEGGKHLGLVAVAEQSQDGLSADTASQDGHLFAHTAQRHKDIDKAAKYAQRPDESDRKSTRLNSSHIPLSRMPSSA